MMSKDYRGRHLILIQSYLLIIEGALVAAAQTAPINSVSAPLEAQAPTSISILSTYRQFTKGLDNLHLQLQNPLAPGSGRPEADSHLISPWETSMTPVSPVQVQSFKYWNGDPVRTPSPKGLESFIPPPFHLAEHLGIGTNSVHLEISYFDGQLFTSIDSGFNIQQRLRYDIVGHFHLSPKAGILETFRAFIESRTRVKTRDIKIGPEVKPHKVSLQKWHLDDETRRLPIMTPWYLERLDLRFPEDFRRVEQTPTEQEAEQALRQELMNRIRLQQAKQRSEIVAQQLAHIQNSDLLESVEQARIALSNWETNSGHGISCATPYHSSSLLSRESIVKSIKLQAQTGKAWQLNPELRTRNQQTALNTVLHGLAHRLASEEDGLFVELLLELARLKVARP